MTRIENVEISPGLGTLEMFKFMKYEPWYAIGEFVDNSIGSWQRNRTSLERLHGKTFILEIRIYLDPSDGGELRVWDNAAGISGDDYSRAFRPADRPPDQTNLNRYGMGMKTAACWFSDHWSVSSTALDEPVERTIKFDIPRIVKNGKSSLKPTSRAADRDDHWTELLLWNLDKSPHPKTVTKIKSYLAQMYRRFLESGKVQIFWNDELLQYVERQTLIAPLYSDKSETKLRWEKRFTLTLPKGESVTGRAKLFDKGSQIDAGLYLFWRGRLIKGSLEDRYRPVEIFGQGNSFRQQRLLVELDLDDFSPTVDKTDFTWAKDGSSEAQLLSSLRRELNSKPLPLLDQAEQYRSNKLEKGARKAAEVAADETAGVIEKHGATELEAQRERKSSVVEPLPTPKAGESAFESALDLVVDGQKWRIAIQLSDREVDRNRWLEITERVTKQSNGTRQLGIRISLTNPFTVTFATDQRSLTVMIRLAAAIALAEVTARDAGVKSAGEIRRNINELITKVLSSQ